LVNYWLKVKKMPDRCNRQIDMGLVTSLETKNKFNNNFGKEILLNKVLNCKIGLKNQLFSFFQIISPEF